MLRNQGSKWRVKAERPGGAAPEATGAGVDGGERPAKPRAGQRTGPGGGKWRPRYADGPQPAVRGARPGPEPEEGGPEAQGPEGEEAEARADPGARAEQAAATVAADAPHHGGQKHAPAYSSSARGRPADWNGDGALYWGRKVEGHFPEVGGARVDVGTIQDFLKQRKDKWKRPVLRLLGEPEPQGDGWFRLPWRFKEGEEEALEADGWERAWHGCKLESIYSILFHGRLIESRDRDRGDRMLDGAPGVYVHKDATSHKAENYTRFVQLCGDGVFWAVKWEVRVDRRDRVKVPRQTDQWVQRARGVRLAALWVCGRTASEMRPGDAVVPRWDPALEANPESEEWTLRAEEEDRADAAERAAVDEALALVPEWTASERLARAGAPPYLEVRQEGGWEELFCLLCRRWADQAHLVSTRHLERAKRPFEYMDADAKAHEVGSGALEQPAALEWPGAAGAAASLPVACKRYITRRWDNGWDGDYCLLCRKWVTTMHLESKAHLRRMASPQDYLSDGDAASAGEVGDSDGGSEDAVMAQAPQDIGTAFWRRPSVATWRALLPAQPRAAFARRPSVITWCCPRPRGGLA